MKLTFKFQVGTSKNVTRIAPSIICPNEFIYSPCNCFARDDGLTSQLDCSNRNLDDAMIEEILDAFHFVAAGRLLGRLDLQNNNLTRVPEQIKLFKLLDKLDLEDNKITFINPGSFNFSQSIFQSYKSLQNWHF